MGVCGHMYIFINIKLSSVSSTGAHLQWYSSSPTHGIKDDIRHLRITQPVKNNRNKKKLKFNTVPQSNVIILRHRFSLTVFT